MYLDYYDLAREPFDITPDPAFLYLSPSHKEALGSVICGCQMRKGFIVITGEVGTGKTTIIRACLKRVYSERANCVYLFNPDITFSELLEDIFYELDLKPEKNDVRSMIKQFAEFVVKEYSRNRNVILIIDEAQNIPVPTLEKLRVLSNLETAKDKLLQIVLVGQPEFDDVLNRKEMRQFKQRIAARATLRALKPRECMEYVRHRLALSSRGKKQVFTRGALRRIVNYSGGIPRVINVLCNSALIAGYGYEKRPITGKIVREVIADYEGTEFVRWSGWQKACVAGVFAVLMAVLVFVYAKWNGMDMLSELAAAIMSVSARL